MCWLVCERLCEMIGAVEMLHSETGGCLHNLRNWGIVDVRHSLRERCRLSWYVLYYNSAPACCSLPPCGGLHPLTLIGCTGELGVVGSGKLNKRDLGVKISVGPLKLGNTTCVLTMTVRDKQDVVTPIPIWREIDTILGRPAAATRVGKKSKRKLQHRPMHLKTKC